MRRKIIHYSPKLKELARRLRNESTLGEILLWKKLRNKQLMGYDFHRQKPIDRFIVDFYCSELNLAIEVDGGYHDSDLALERDKTRQTRLESLGVKFLRFKDAEVRRNMDGVLAVVQEWTKTNA